MASPQLNNSIENGGTIKVGEKNTIENGRIIKFEKKTRLRGNKTLLHYLCPAYINIVTFFFSGGAVRI